VRLDFVRPARGVAPGAAAALVAGALVLGAAMWTYGSARAERDALDASLPSRQAAGSRGAAAKDAPDRARAEGVLASLGLPWATLFDALEASAGHGIVLTGLQPEAEARRVRITGLARRFEDIAAYAGRLQGTGVLANVQLASHETREQRTQFTLQADWGERP
jgi:Tfp pilus assembly protein PilN